MVICDKIRKAASYYVGTYLSSFEITNLKVINANKIRRFLRNVIASSGNVCFMFRLDNLLVLLISL